MPGISGIINSPPPLNDPNQIVSTFKKVHALKGVNLIQRTFRSNHCVIVNMLTGIIKTTLDQPASDPTGNTFLFLEGEIYNIKELLSHLSQPQDQPLCNTLLTLFLERGTDFVSLLDGDFNIVIYQKAERRLIILNDYLSCKPMYYMQQGNSLLFGSEKKSILAVTQQPPAIDSIGLLQTFAHRFNVGGKTFVKGLKRLPPASRLEYHEGQLKLTRYDVMRYSVSKPMPPIHSLVEEWGDHLKRASTRRLKGKERLIISLSGGLDSRAAICAIPRDLRPLSAWTWGFPDSLEVIYATEIANRLNIDHIYQEPMAVPLSEILPKVVWRTECSVLFSDCRSIAYHRTMKEHADFITGGWLGTVSSGSHIYPFSLLPGNRSQLIERAYRWYRRPSNAWLEQVFNKEFLHKNLPGLKDTFFASFDILEGENNAQLYEIWDLYERQTRMTLSTAAVDSHLFEKVELFRDRKYMDFTQTLPVRLRFGQSLYRAMIYNIGPEIRDIPNSNTGLKVGRTIAENFSKTCITMGLKARKKLLKKAGLYKQKRYMGDTAESITAVTRQDLKLRHIIQEFVHSNDFDPSIFNKPGIQSMLDRHYQGAADYAYPLCYFATFATGLPYFIYNRPCHCPAEAEPMSWAEPNS